MLPKFHRSECEQPYIHLNKFPTISHMFKNQNLNSETMKLWLFPLSLEDHAAPWLNSLTPNCIATWDELVKKFMSNFFLVSVPLGTLGDDPRKSLSKPGRDSVTCWLEAHITWLTKESWYNSFIEFLWAPGVSWLNQCTKENSWTRLSIKHMNS